MTQVKIYSAFAMEAPLGKALAAKKLLEVKSVRLDAHEEGDACLRSQLECLSACACEGES